MFLTQIVVKGCVSDAGCSEGVCFWSLFPLFTASVHLGTK